MVSAQFGQYRPNQNVQVINNDGRYQGGNDGRYVASNEGKYNGADGKYVHDAQNYNGGFGSYSGSAQQYQGGNK